jgi:L-arabonate dehydrase
VIPCQPNTRRDQIKMGSVGAAALSQARPLLRLVRDGDMIEVDVEARKIHPDVSEEDLAARRSQRKKPDQRCRADTSNCTSIMMQANMGADFDFLLGRRGVAVPRESH